MNMKSFGIIVALLLPLLAGCGAQENLVERRSVPDLSAMAVAAQAATPEVTPDQATPAPVADLAPGVKVRAIDENTRVVLSTTVNLCRKQIVGVMQVRDEDGDWVSTGSPSLIELTTQGCATAQDLLRSGPGVVLAAISAGKI